MNVYELDITNLRIWTFKRAADWLEYILQNRKGGVDIHGDCDMIMGPIATDTLFETYGIITSGLLTQEQALELLSIGPDFTQVAIKTEKGANALIWLESYEPDAAAMEEVLANYKREKELFDAAFAEALDRMDIE